MPSYSAILAMYHGLSAFMPCEYRLPSFLIRHCNNFSFRNARTNVREFVVHEINSVRCAESETMRQSFCPQQLPKETNSLNEGVCRGRNHNFTDISVGRLGRNHFRHVRWDGALLAC